MPSKPGGTLAFLLIALCGFATTSLAKAISDESAAIRGIIIDDAGRPVKDASVFVYSARLKQGYAIVCPTCWIDCGKRADTDADGQFTISGLNSALKFRLLVAKDGFVAAGKGNVDPAQGPLSPIKITPRAPPTDDSKVVHGRITDMTGNSIAGAVVEPVREIQGGTTAVGTMDWIDRLAVSNTSGEFTVISTQPVDQVVLKISPRGLAAKLVATRPGAAINSIVLTQGATIMGRLVEPNGTPVAHAEMVMTSHDHMNGEELSDERVGTDNDGSFVFTNVPAHRIWGIYPTPDSLGNQNLSAAPHWCETTADGQVINLGALKLLPGYAVSGKIDLLDKMSVPPGMHVDIQAEGGANQLADIEPDGRFAFKALAPGIYSFNVGISGYTPIADSPQELLVERDRRNLIIHMARSP